MKTGLRSESHEPQTIPAPALYAGFQLAIAENDAFADGNLSSRPHQGLPKGGFDLPHQQDFDRSAQVLVASSTVSSRLLGTNTHTSSEQPGRKHSRIVENNKLIAAEDFREIAKLAILRRAGHPIDDQHPRCVALVQWMLRNQLRR